MLCKRNNVSRNRTRCVVRMCLDYLTALEASGRYHSVRVVRLPLLDRNIEMILNRLRIAFFVYFCTTSFNEVQ